MVNLLVLNTETPGSQVNVKLCVQFCTAFNYYFYGRWLGPPEQGREIPPLFVGDSLTLLPHIYCFGYYFYGFCE